MLENEAEVQTLGEQMNRVLQELAPNCRAVLLLHRRDVCVANSKIST